MRVIDARSGKELQIGDVARYPQGEFVRLIDVDEGLLSATAIVEYGFIDHTKDDRPVITIRRQIPLTVRFFHPTFFMQKVAFIET